MNNALNESPQQQTADDDINSTRSPKKGWAGFFETMIRKFQTIAFLICLIPLILMTVSCIGISLAPGIYVFMRLSMFVADQSMPVQALVYGLASGLAVVLFIITLIFVVPLFNLPVRPFVKSYRGAWYSLEAIPWYYHNALTYIVRYTILDFLTPSPLNILFFKMMGMRIGKGAIINTSNISDPCLIIIEDYVTVGGSVYMMAHYGMKGYLIIDKLHLKRGAMIGLGAKLLGGVTIGEKATVLPNSAVLPKTTVGSKEKFGVISIVQN